MSTGTMRATARQLQTAAAAYPLADADFAIDPNDPRYFAKVNRELTWGLTLNK